MDVRAELRHYRVGPRKVRLLTNLLHGKSVADAEAQLRHMGKVAAPDLLKLLKSAVANAKHNFKLAEDTLYIKQFLTNEGSKLKRYQPKAFGRAGLMIRRSSHITLILGERAAPEAKPTRPRVASKKKTTTKAAAPAAAPAPAKEATAEASVTPPTPESTK